MKILLIVYDNDSYIHWFPQGLAYIASALMGEGHEVEIYNQDVHHYPEAHLTEYLDRNNFDFVGISAIGGYYQYRKILKLAEAVNRSKNRPFFALGGHGPAPEPEFFIKKTNADAVVIGEGEITAVELLDAIAGNRALGDVKGIAYRERRRVVVNERRGLIEDIDTIPIPAYRLFPIEYYRLLRLPYTTNRDFVMTVASSRGCTFNCNFCYRMDKGIRLRSNAAIIDEMKLLKKDYGINYIIFSDELFMSSIERTASLCEDFIKHGLGMRWFCNGRLNYAKADLLKLMKRAGCVFINYGIESMDNEALEVMNKALTTDQIIKGIEATLRSGISPGFNIIFGNIGETVETLKKGVEFLLKYDDGTQMRTIRPVTPYPGSPLYYYAIEKGMLKGAEDFYENRHVNSDLLAVNFTNMSDDEFHRALLEANTKLIANYFKKKEREQVANAQRLYLGKDAGFRGFRQS